MMSKLSFKGISCGIILSLVLDVIAGIAAMAFMVDINLDLDDQAFSESITAAAHTTPFLVFSLIFGTFTTVLGGYVAARMAKQLPYMNAAAVGVLGLMICIFLADGQVPWFDIMGYIVTLPAALLGGHFAASKRQVQV